MATTTTSIKGGVDLPIAPYRAWLASLIAEEETRVRYSRRNRGLQEVAWRIGISPRRLRAHLEPGRQVISDLIVDRITMYEGSTSLGELYPDGAATLYSEPSWPIEEAKRYVPSCATPRCEQLATLGGRFCPPCGERLARIREAYEADAQKVKDRKGRKDARSTCCRVGCWEPRLRSERFCDRCSEEMDAAA